MLPQYLLPYHCDPHFLSLKASQSILKQDCSQLRRTLLDSLGFRGENPIVGDKVTLVAMRQC